MKPLGSDSPLAETFLNETWAALGGDPDIPDRVSFVGDRALPGCFGYTDLVAGTLGAASAAIAELLAAAGHEPPPVRVDRVLASGWVTSLTRPIQPRVPLAWPWTVNGEYQTADDRYLRLTAVFEHLHQRTIAALGNPRDRGELAAVIRSLPADEAERMVVEGGSVAAASRSIAQWRDHPQGRAVRAEPLIAVGERGGIEDRWKPTPGRPLAGIRVLDMTRVIAGPMATRWLAGFGAEVLRLDPPEFGEWIVEPDPIGLTLGKRCARLDLREEAGKARFLDLLASADIFVHGLRPGVFEKLGLGQELRDSINPGIVEVQHNAYGWTGPWRDRRGFDSIVCYSSGVWWETMRDAGHAEPSEKTLHLIQPILLDHCAGYLDAAAAVSGLTRRLKRGAGSLSRLSLARMLWMMIDGGRPQAEPALELPLDGPYEERIHMTPSGAVRRLEFPAPVTGNQFHWERPGDPYGTSSPEWITSRDVGRIDTSKDARATFSSQLSVQ